MEDAKEVLSREITEDGAKRIERTLAHARAEVERIIAAATAEAKSETEKSLSAARDTAEKRRQTILRTVAHEVARRTLGAREEILSEVLAQARAEIEQLRGARYRQSLLNLALEPLQAMPDGQAILKIGAAGQDEFDAHSFAAEMENKLRATGRKVSLRIEVNPEGSKGVVAESADGKLRWDNTYDARLRRHHAELRKLLARTLFEES